MLVSQYKSRIQNKYEGGKSLSVDWHLNAQEAGEILRQGINPPSLKRVAAIFGGLNNATDVYYCPDDVGVPSALYSNTTRERWEYMPPQAFHLDENDYKFTIETINGVKFLLVRHALVSGTLTVDKFDVVGSKTGITLSVNALDYLTGDGSLQGTFSDSLTDVIETLAAVIDITDYKRGVALVPAKFVTAENVASVKLMLYTDGSNYYTMSSLVDSVGDYIRDGWNMIRFDVANAVATGTPTDTSIASYKLEITMESGTSQVVVLDKISLEKTALYNFEYYSTKMFQDKDDNSWKDTTDDDADTINLGEKEAELLVYEGAILVGESATKPNKVKEQDLVGSLARRYNAYWANNPSSELCPSYSGLTDISKKLNI